MYLIPLYADMPSYDPYIDDCFEFASSHHHDDRGCFIRVLFSEARLVHKEVFAVLYLPRNLTYIIAYQLLKIILLIIFVILRQKQDVISVVFVDMQLSGGVKRGIVV